MFAALPLQQEGDAERLRLFDTFEAMTEPTVGVDGVAVPITGKSPRVA